MNWESYVRKVVPYTPGEQPKKTHMIKLNTNECPYPPSPAVQKVIAEFPYERGRLYPDPTADRLVGAIAEYYKVDKQQVFVGVGSDDVLAMTFLTFFGSDKPVLFPDITYSFYDVWADLFRIPYETVALDDAFHIRTGDYERENGGIIFPNPNAPTGVAMALSDIRKILDANRDVIVVVDEAYIDFGGESALSLIDEYDNLLVVQTYSKSRALAGSRIGFAIGNAKLISYLNDVKFSFNSYTMDHITIEAGRAAIQDEEYFREITQKIISTRERAKVELKQLGFTFRDSASNFIFATHNEMPAEQIFKALRERDIYVRYFNKPRINNYLRITIGTDEQMDALYQALKEILPC